MMAVRSPLTTAQRLKRLTPLLAAPAALLLNPGRADAVLTYNIFESGFDVVVQTSGSLNLPAQLPPPTFLPNPIQCQVFGAIISSFGYVGVCGPGTDLNQYPVTGPSAFSGSQSVSVASSNYSGINSVISGVSFPVFAIDPAYTNGSPINSNIIYNNRTLAGLGFTTTGLLGSWQLNGVSGPDGQINVVLGPPAAAAAVPGPLPLLGVAAAFGWSRRLRRRITTAKTTAAG